MRKSSLFLIAFALMAFAALPASANTTASTPISGTYEGSMETKSFFKNNTTEKSTTNIGIEILFNGNVFIYQAGDTKCMGNYSTNGDEITFEVNSIKGDAELVKSIFGNSFKFSKSGDRLMLISNNNPNGDVFIYKLTKSTS